MLNVLFNMQHYFFSAAFFLMMNCAMAPSVVKTYAYSRATLPGIREEIVNESDAVAPRKTPLPLTYFLYVEVPKGSNVSVNGVWLHGKYYTATLEKVSTPVVIRTDPVVVTEQRDTLVKKTANDVYAVLLVDEVTRDPSDTAERQLITNNEAIVFLTINKVPCYSNVKTIKTLKPAAGM
jgi:hypothetical protein